MERMMMETDERVTPVDLPAAISLARLDDFIGQPLRRSRRAAAQLKTVTIISPWSVSNQGDIGLPEGGWWLSRTSKYSYSTHV